MDANRYGYRAVRLKGADVLEYRPEHYESFQRQETFRTEHVPLKSRPEFRGSEVLEVLHLVENKVSQVFGKWFKLEDPEDKCKPLRLELSLTFVNYQVFLFSFFFFFPYLTSKVCTII